MIYDLEKSLRKVKYELSTQSVRKLPIDQGVEWAFMGRSNSGKSSLLNSLTGVKIAKTSKTPGRTQCMNVFSLDESTRLIDFPGYGFAKVNKEQIVKWHAMIEQYINSRACLAGICIITDIRHVGIKTDMDFFSLACSQNVPIRIILNKADKLSKNQIMQSVQKMQSIVQIFNHPDISVQQYSVLKQTGADFLITWLQEHS